MTVDAFVHLHLGAFSFFRTMTKVGIKPIIGIEAYVAPGSAGSRTQEFWDPRSSR